MKLAFLGLGLWAFRWRVIWQARDIMWLFTTGHRRKLGDGPVPMMGLPASIGEAVRGAEIVMACVGDDNDVRQVCLCCL